MFNKLNVLVKQYLQPFHKKRVIIKTLFMEEIILTVA